ncbi:hypothetical protein HZB00_03505 [Candidatus Woesearchaeota archaeon]|nr:hypothetical protein [Candidatus Woesearchaeota archaeon]
MTEIHQALETMYEAEMRERNNRRLKTQPDYALIAAGVLVLITGLLVPSPANWYIWTVGIAGIIVAKNLL